MAGCSDCIQLHHLPDDFLDELRDSGVLASMPSATGTTSSAVPVSSAVAGAGAVAATATAAAPDAVASFLPPATSEATQPIRLENVALDAMAHALRTTKGNVSVAAKMLGVSRNTIYRKKAQLPDDVWT